MNGVGNRFLDLYHVGFLENEQTELSGNVCIDKPLKVQEAQCGASKLYTLYCKCKDSTEA